MTTIKVDSPEFATLPRTIRQLVIEAVAVGGEVEVLAERLFAIALPVKYVSGNRGMVRRANVGYYVKDRKNVIRGIADARREIAYWGKQSRG